MPEDERSLKEAYKKHFRKSVLIIVALAVLTAVTAIVSVSVSDYPIGLVEAYQIIIDRINGFIPQYPQQSYQVWVKYQFVWETNLPKAIGAVAVGAILGVGGAVIQSIIKNPIADPYTTGIASGALFGVTIFVVLGISIVPFAGGDLPMIVNAFIFALVPAAIIIFVSTFKKTGPTMMVLIGIGVMYIFSASATLLKYTASDESIADIYNWGVGSLFKVGWDNVPLLVGAMIFIIAASMYLSKSINILSSGDNSAKSLGVNPFRMRLICLVIVSVTVAIAVCFTGTIGFVGLVAPHIARMTVGSNLRYLIPCSAMVGAFMLIAAECIARDAGLPVGVITALVGSPLFLYFLIRQKKSAW